MSDPGVPAAAAPVQAVALGEDPPRADARPFGVILRPADIMAISVPFLFGLTLAVYGGTVRDGYTAAAAMMGAAAAGLLCRLWASNSRYAVAHAFGNFYCIATVGIAYSHLNPLIDIISPVTYDRELQALDEHIFGVQGSVWLEQFSVPWLTEVLYICYALFFFWQLALGVLLHMRNNGDFDDYFLTVITFYMISYCGYVLIPAIGPRFDLAHLYTTELHGIWLGDSIRMRFIDIPMTRDCFPSGHTGLTLLVMIRAFDKKAYRFLAVMFPFGVLLIFSTVYCRFHYVTDLLCALPFITGVLCVDAALRRLFPEGLFVRLPTPHPVALERVA